MPRAAAKNVRGDDLALVLADVGQQPHAGHVADRPQPLVRAQPRVDRDAPRVGCDPDRFQSCGYPGAPAGGHEQSVTAQLATVVEGEDVVRPVSACRGGVCPDDQVDAVAAQHLAESLAQRRRQPGEHMSGALDEYDLRTQSTHRLGQLDAHRSAAEDQQAAWDGGHARRLPVGPHALQLEQTGNRGQHRIGPGCHDHVPGGVVHPVDLDHTRPGERAGPAQQVDAVGLQPALLARVGVLRHHEVAPGQRGLDVDPRGGRHIMRGPDGLTGSQQRLGRNACPVRTLATHQFPLDDGDSQAPLGQLTRAVFTG